MTWPAVIQAVGLILVAVGVGLVFGVGVGLVVFGAGVLAFGIASEREAVTDGVRKPDTRP